MSMRSALSSAPNFNQLDSIRILTHVRPAMRFRTPHMLKIFALYSLASLCVCVCDVQANQFRTTPGISFMSFDRFSNNLINYLLRPESQRFLVDNDEYWIAFIRYGARKPRLVQRHIFPEENSTGAVFAKLTSLRSEQSLCCASLVAYQRSRGAPPRNVIFMMAKPYIVSCNRIRAES